jgi:hypothetical protein
MKMWKIFVLLFILLFLLWFLKFAKHYPSRADLRSDADFWGVTFSLKFTKSLGLDWRETYKAVLDDLGVKNIRIPIYWDDVEKTPGDFDFYEYDLMFDEGAKRNVKFIANIGARLPRWPECHLPAWLADKSEEEIKAETLRMLELFINRYKERPEISAWQIENEPLVDWFGACPKSDENFLRQEVALVKTLDNRPIIISASGELSMWQREAQAGDVLATTLYRVVWNPVFKYFRYPIPAWFYNWKANRVEKTADKMIVSELQTEPWVPSGEMVNLTTKEINKSFSLRQFEANLLYAQKIDFHQTYLWGVEWWYWQKLYADKGYWEKARSLFR